MEHAVLEAEHAIAEHWAQHAECEHARAIAAEDTRMLAAQMRRTELWARIADARARR